MLAAPGTGVTGLQDEPRPVGKRIEAHPVTAREFVAKRTPRLQSRRHTAGGVRNVKQHGFAAFHDRQVNEYVGGSAGGREELGGGADKGGVERVMRETEGDADFFAREGRLIGRQRGIEMAAVMRRATFNRAAEQPGGQVRGSAAAYSAEPPQEGRGMGDIADALRECWSLKLLAQFHREDSSTQRGW